MTPFEHRLDIVGWSKQANYKMLLALVTLVYYGAARLGLLVAFESTNASPVWPPTGIAFAAVLLFGIRIWPAIALGAYLANFAVFSANHVAPGTTTAVASLIIAMGNTLEAIVGATILRRFVKTESLFEQPSHVFKFSLTVMVMSAVSAVVGSQALIVTDMAPSTARTNILLNWWLGDVGGASVLMPALMCWFCPREVARPRRSPAEMVFSIVAIVAIAATVFGDGLLKLPDQRLLLVGCFACEAWAAYRFGLRGVTLASLVFAAAAVVTTVHGVGPFTAGPLNDSLILLVSFIALVSISGLVLAADLVERDALRKDMPAKLRELLWPWSALIVALSITVVAWHLMSINTERRATDQFRRSTEEIQLRITERLADVESILRGAQGLFAASDVTTQAHWHEYIDRLELRQRVPGILATGYAPLIIQSEAGSRLFNDSAATGLDAKPTWPMTPHTFEVPVLYVEPLDDINKRVIGFNMLSEASRRQAMLLARDSGEPVITRNVALIQDGDLARPNAAIMFMPIYRRTASPKTLEARREALTGFVYAAFRVDDIINGAISDQMEGMRFEVFDGDDVSIAPRIYGQGLPTTSVTKDSILAAELPTKLGHRIWTLKFAAGPEFEETVDRQKAQLVLISCSVISLLLFTLMRSLALTTTQALRMADDMNTALRNSEERLRLLIDGVKESAIFMLDPTGRVISWNSGAEKIKGYCSKEILGKHFSTFYTSDDVATNHPAEVLRIAADTGQFHEEGWRVRKDGTLFWAEVSISSLHDQDGNLRGYSKVTRDLSERKQAEEALGSLSQRLSLATQAAGIGVWELNIQTGVLNWDEQMYAMYKIKKEDATNDYAMWSGRVAEDDLARTESTLHAAIESNDRFVAEFGIVTPDGEIRSISAVAAIIPDKTGNPQTLVGVNWDVTDMRRTQNALGSSEERFRSAMEYAPIGMAVVALNGTWLEVNRAICDIVGYEKEELMKLTFQDITHPDDLGDDLSSAEALVNGKIQTYQMEKRYISKQRQIVWVRLTVSLVKDRDQKPLYFISQIEDITQRRESEQELQSTLALQAAILDSANVIIIATRTDGIITLFNLAAQRLLGYSENEVVGIATPVAIHDSGEIERRAKILSRESQRDVSSDFGVFITKTQNGGADENEWTYIRKDGSRFPVLLSVSAIRDAHDEITGYVGIASDISDRKQKDHQIRVALAEKEILLKEVYHRVKNNLQVIISLFNLQINTLSDGIAKAALQESSERVRAMALVHEKLYQSSNLASLRVVEYVTSLCRQLESSYAVRQGAVSIRCDIDDLELGMDTAIPLGLLLNELISNCTKHAFSEGQAGHIYVSLKCRRDSMAELKVVDDGVGIPEFFMSKISLSLGIKLSHALAQQLGGSIVFERIDKGTQVTVVFKLPDDTSDPVERSRLMDAK